MIGAALFSSPLAPPHFPRYDPAMDPIRLRDLLDGVREGTTSVSEALARLRSLPFAEVGEVARVDHHRHLRCGAPEVIFCPGKRPEDVGRIAEEIVRAGSSLLATRAGVAYFEAIRAIAPAARYHEAARCVTLEREPAVERRGLVAIATAGTSDLPVAEEARVTAELFGSRVRLFCDMGVAGVHRLLAAREALEEANVVIVVAGMEGALPSVAGGLVSKPVIAVPTSVGYGASFGGLAALLGMLNSCAAGVAVVNIDNGFGAAMIAHRINAAIVSAAKA
jgi:NCAIR mutase (PurE)-related protein